MDCQSGGAESDGERGSSKYSSRAVDFAGAAIETLSMGAGAAGKVQVSADTITASGTVPLKSLLAPTGSSSSRISSETYASGAGGDVTVVARQLTLKESGIISTAVFPGATGRGGNISVNVAEDISAIAASAPIVNETTRQFYGLPDAPTGNAGRLSITTKRFTGRDDAYVNLTNSRTGNAGQLSIQADQVSLDNGRIRASTASGQGGDINLDVAKLLLLRHGSTITTEAGGNGNGGNITINTPLIVGLENSDIIANAFEGKGGNIQISTQGIFGLKYRPRLTSENDITASSEFGVNGNVQITSPNVDPNSGLIQLPGNLVDPSQQIATGCASNQGSRFVATGRGGIPQNPNQQLTSDRTWSDIRDLSAYRKTGEVTVQIPAPPETLIPATSWHRNAQGKVELVADKSSTQVQSSLSCAAVPKS